MSKEAELIRLRIYRGKQEVEETEMYQTTPSQMNELTTVNFNPDPKEMSRWMCRFRWDKRKGQPKPKTATLQVLKRLPQEKEMYVEIASKKIEFSKHFGPEFGEKTVQMDISEGVRGIYVKSITFYAQVKQFHKRDSELFDRCVEWRREKHKMQQERNKIQSLARQADNMEIKKERVYELKKRNTAPDISLLFDQL